MKKIDIDFVRSSLAAVIVAIAGIVAVGNPALGCFYILLAIYLHVIAI